MRVNGSDSRKPWCPVCESHTDYHLESESSSMYTCNECGSSTWKPTAPVPLTIVVLGLVFSLNALAFAALSGKISSGLNLENGFAAVVIWVVSIMLLIVVWNNWEHWRKFHRWKKKQRH
ncbi:MAG: hypothetical protein QF426_04710 [Verrucomicrobiales bacterium]|nr:hypothetical protein [Verrucomicrobiales bacterium]